MFSVYRPDLGCPQAQTSLLVSYQTTFFGLCVEGFLVLDLEVAGEVDLDGGYS